jgi:ACT domain-containing protein
MANTFKRQTSNGIAATLVDIYTVPASTTAVIIGGVVSNTDASTTISTTISVNDGTNEINLTGTDTPVPSGTALSFIDGKVVLQTGDVLKAKGSVAGKLDVMLSIMEIT